MKWEVLINNQTKEIAMKKLTEMIIKNPLRKPCILFAAVLLIFSTGLCACGAKKESKTEISIENENVSIHAENSTLKLDLIGNSSTGYEWTVEVENEDLLAQTDFTVEPIKNDESEEELVGGPSLYKYTFEASGDGTTELTLKYARSWETTPDDIEYTYKVRVEKGIIKEIA